MTGRIPRVAVLDYGSGNIHSVVRAFQATGAEVELTTDRGRALSADGLVVPGVGAFAACMEQLTAVGGIELIQTRVTAGRPLLGICVGHQILFASGVEHGIHSAGVGIFPGSVRQLPTTRLPHMGWNEVTGFGSRFVPSSTRFYFVHSYAALTHQDLPAGAVPLWATHDGVTFIAAAEWGPVLSTQFHPEKSGAAGLALIHRWTDGLGAA